MDFDYFYRRDGERYSFYMLPKVLVTDDRFKNLSSDAKVLYSCLLDRNTLSNRNGWIDEEERVYIIFTINEIMKCLNKSNRTAVKILNELEKIGLIQRKRQGLGKPNLIYVMDFMTGLDCECNNYTPEVKNLHSRNVESTLQEVKKVHGTNTNNINTDNSNTYFKGEQKVYGGFKNVFLSDRQIEELKNTVGIQLDNYIERLSTYIKSSGKEYKDHGATILSWFYKDQGNRKIQTTRKAPSLADYDKGDYL